MTGQSRAAEQLPYRKGKLKRQKKDNFILFIEFLLSFKLLFTVLKNSNYFLKYDRLKSGRITGF